AAYSTLLHSRRQQLHAHIVATLEERFPEVRAPHLLIVGHLLAAMSLWMCEPVKVREHADRVPALYSEERNCYLVDILTLDPKSVSLSASALSRWMLGYPEQAVGIIDVAHDHARQRGHPVNLGVHLTIGAQVFDYLHEPDAALKRVAEADRVGR